MKFIKSLKSPNFNERKGIYKINYLILHYTAMKSVDEALEYICEKKNKVSAHFLISKKGLVYQLVDIDKRAWHAGLSYWKGLTDLNSNSIGIELDNSGPYINNEKFSNMQIKSLCNLILKLKNDYKIISHNILGHSDIAPFRKFDPGDKFPWIELHSKKLCYYPFVKKTNNNAELENKKLILNDKKKIEILRKLKDIGYDTRRVILKDKKFINLIQAYQRHFRQINVSGKIDKETASLIDQHHKDLLTKV